MPHPRERGVGAVYGGRGGAAYSFDVDDSPLTREMSDGPID